MFENSKEDFDLSFIGKRVTRLAFYSFGKAVCSMSRILAVLLLVTTLPLSGAGQQGQTGRPITREEFNAMTLKAAAPNVRSVAKILKNEKVEIDAELLFTRDGRKLLLPQLEKFPAMQSAKLYSEPLRG